MPEYFYIMIIVLVAGFVQGVAGFGFSLMAVPIMTFFVGVKQAVPLCVLLGLITMVVLAVQLKGHLVWRRLRHIYIGLVPGIAAGTFLLKKLPDNIVETFIGTFLLAYTLYSLFFRTTLRQLHPLWGSAAGFLSGAISASVGGGGPPVVVYTSLSGWKRDEMKASLVVCFVGMTGMTAAAHAMSGLTSGEVLGLFFLTAPAALAGLALGVWKYGRLYRDRYRRVLNVLLGILGVLLIIRAF